VNIRSASANARDLLFVKPLTNDQLLEIIAKLERQNQELTERLDLALKRIKELEEKLGTNSNNSSLPPSQDPHRHRKKKGKGGKRGGKPGHIGKARQPFSQEQVTRIVTHTPSSCPHCGGQNLTPSKTLETVQQVEMPPIQLTVVEHRRLRCQCRDCGRASNGKWPENFSYKLFGPRLAAFVCLLISQYHLSRRSVQHLLHELFNLRFALGTAVNIAKSLSEALEEPWKAAGERVKQAPIKHADETSWFNEHCIHWLWCAKDTASTVFFQIFKARSAESAKTFLGSQEGNALITDRYAAYSHLGGIQQYCWGHLKRDFTKISERSGADGVFGKMLLSVEKRVFELWHHFKAREIDRDELKRQMQPLRDELSLCLKASQEYECGSKTANTCANILKDESRLWLFVEMEGVEPTNNAAERAIRPVVLLRKVSLGTQSDHGMRFVERTQTMIATLKGLGKSIWSYFEEALKARQNHQPAPSCC
jgi:transposase